MSFEERKAWFGGLPVVAFPEGPELPVPEVDPGAVAWRLGFNGTDWDSDTAPGDYDPDADQPFDGLFAGFLDRVDPARVRALVIGAPRKFDDQSTGSAVKLFVRHADRFPALRAVFVGDVLREESDVAYLTAGPLNPILDAFPELEVLGSRGDHFMWEDEATLPTFRATAHARLRSLTLESGGLDPGVIRAVAASELPELEHLELYLGDPAYNGTAGVEDVAAILDGGVFPKLRCLGIKDSVIQDEIGAAVAHAPVVARLEELDLSLGVLSDEGAAALLAGQPLTHLRRLNLRHHYLSDSMMQRLRTALPGVELDLEEQQFASEARDRYIAVSE